LVTPQTPPTRRGLLPEAAHVVLPAGIVATGFPSVQNTCREVGIEFDPWQCDLNRAILAKDASGMYAADTVAISIPRQVGKTYDIGALVFADCIINPGTTTVWTAHRFKVARETFDSLRAMATSVKMAAHVDVDAITTAAGNECIPFRNGSRIVFAARERGAIRGFTKVRRIILDEAQILSEAALADMVPTMNQASNPQIILMGTPPKPTDPAEVFKAIRREAMSGEAEGVVYVEFSAPRGSKPDDRAAWRVANPSFPKRTPAKAILRMKKLLSEADFMREALGIWDDDRAEVAVSPHRWAELEVDEAPNGVLSYGVAFSFDDTRVSVGGAIKSEDRVHVELIDAHNGRRDDGVSELVRWFCDDPDSPERWRKAAQIALCGRAGATVLYEALRARGVPAKVLLLVSTSQYTTGCAMFLDAVRDGTLSHLSGQPPLDDCVTSAEKKSRGQDGAWGWKAPDGHDETPVEAVTVALWAAKTSKRKPGRKAVVDF